MWQFRACVTNKKRKSIKKKNVILYCFSNAVRKETWKCKNYLFSFCKSNLVIKNTLLKIPLPLKLRKVEALGLKS